MYFYSFNPGAASSNISEFRDLFRLTESLFWSFEKAQRNFFIDFSSLQVDVRDILLIHEHFPTAENFDDFLGKFKNSNVKSLLQPDSVWLFEACIRLKNNLHLIDAYNNPTRLSMLASVFRVPRFKSTLKHADNDKFLVGKPNASLHLMLNASKTLCLFENKRPIAIINAQTFWRNWIHYVKQDTLFLKTLYKFQPNLIDFFIFVANLHVNVFKSTSPYFINDIIGLSQHVLPRTLSDRTQTILFIIANAVYTNNGQKVQVPNEIKMLLLQTNQNIADIGLENLFTNAAAK